MGDGVSEAGSIKKCGVEEGNGPTGWQRVQGIFPAVFVCVEETDKTLERSLMCRTHTHTAKYQPQEVTPALAPRRLVVRTCGLSREQGVFATAWGRTHSESPASTRVQGRHARVALLTHQRERPSTTVGKAEKRTGSAAGKRQNSLSHKAGVSSHLPESFLEKRGSMRSRKGPLWVGEEREGGPP